MIMNYYGQQFNIDDVLVNKRKKLFEETEENIMEILKPYMDDKYGKYIDFYVGQHGKESITEELNDLLRVEIELYERV